jgi:outer membrane lipoprotein-sorting protein
MAMKLLIPVLCAFAAASGIQAESVESILSRMDQAAPLFHGISANVQMTTYTKIISDTTVDNGVLKIQRRKEKGTRAILDFSGEKDAREIAFLGNIIRIYYPNLNLYQDIDVGKNSDVLNQFLLLGFGSSGKELSESYDISAEGSENLAGQDTTKLSLTPKTSKVKDRLAKIEMWIPSGAAYPVQQQFYEPSGNFRKVAYSQIKINPPMKGNLELKLPSGARKRSA